MSRHDQQCISEIFENIETTLPSATTSGTGSSSEKIISVFKEIVCQKTAESFWWSFAFESTC